MAVKISGVLKDGAGKPVQNCTIQLKAKRNSTTVVANTVASENPDEAGRYSMDVEYGQYSVILLVEGLAVRRIPYCFSSALSDSVGRLEPSGASAGASMA
ncbi:TPA: prophage tail fiber N-terminal domain-containing protein [Escherichia coli]|nr:prophage tail fiber N-terminal domain-containing protein [Escherichia coli]